MHGRKGISLFEWGLISAAACAAFMVVVETVYYLA